MTECKSPRQGKVAIRGGVAGSVGRVWQVGRGTVARMSNHGCGRRAHAVRTMSRVRTGVRALVATVVYWGAVASAQPALLSDVPGAAAWNTVREDPAEGAHVAFAPTGAHSRGQPLIVSRHQRQVKPATNESGHVGSRPVDQFSSHLIVATGDG